MPCSTLPVTAASYTFVIATFLPEKELPVKFLSVRLLLKHQGIVKKEKRKKRFITLYMKLETIRCVMEAMHQKHLCKPKQEDNLLLKEVNYCHGLSFPGTQALA